MIKLYRYRLRFKKAFHIAGHRWTFRQGHIVRYSGKGVDIAAEIAPLPGFSSESTHDVHKIFVSNHKDLNDFFKNVDGREDIKHLIDQSNYPPSVQFGICCLALDLISHRNGKADIPGPELESGSSIAANAVVGIDCKQTVYSTIKTLYKAGFRTIKLKCGPDASFFQEIIKKATDVFPDLKFRLDANRSWPKKQAIKILDGFSGLPIEYCEEPFQFKNLEEIAVLRADSPLPIALDESIVNFRTLDKILDIHAADVIIIKPMILGSIIDLIERFSQDDTHSVNRVCTTSLESGVGRRSVAKAASIFGSAHLAHGLDTGRLMDEDIFTEHLEQGSPRISIPDCWSTGFSLCNTDKLSEIDL